MESIKNTSEIRATAPHRGAPHLHPSLRYPHREPSPTNRVTTDRSIPLGALFAFLSCADNLTPAGSSGGYHLFLRDLCSGSTNCSQTTAGGP